MNANDDESTDCAQAMLAGALAGHFGERPPDLVASIMERTQQARAAGPAVALRPASRFRSLAAAAVVVLGATAVLAVAVLSKRELVPAQEPARQFWPLDPGAKWVYDVDRQGVATQRTQLAMAVFPFQAATEDAPRSVCQLFVRDGDEAGFDYVACDAHGLFRYPGTRRFAVPGFDPATPAARLLVLPLGVETRWETVESRWRTEDFVGGAPAVVVGGLGGGAATGPVGGAVGGPGGGGGGPGGGAAEGPVGPAGGAGGRMGPAAGRSRRVLDTKQVELVAPTVAVKVPAGEFQAAHVRLTTVDKEGGEPIVEQLWFATGVGLVRRVVAKGDKTLETAELRSFAPGRPEPDAKTVLPKFLQRDAGVANLGPAQATEWIDPAANNLRLRGRFALVTFVDRKVVFCVRGGAVTTFDPADAEQWSALIGDEQMTGWNDGLLPQARSTALVDLAARIHVAQEGLKILKGPEWRFSVGPNGSDEHHVLHCADATGEARRVTVDLLIGTDDRVSKIEFAK